MIVITRDDCSWNSSLVLLGGRYQLATKWEVLFANTFTQIDSESFSSSVIGICEMSLWTSNMTPPPWIFLSFLYTLYGKVSGKSSEVATELSILVSWIATTCGWWKSRKASNSSFFAFYAIDIHANEFQPINKAAFICTTRWRPIFLLLLEEQAYFQVHLFTKERIRKVAEFTFRANPCTVCMAHSFILSFCDEWAFIMDPHITTVTLSCFVTL